MFYIIIQIINIIELSNLFFFKEKGKIIYLLVDNKFISNGKKQALEEAKKEQSANNLLSMLD